MKTERITHAVMRPRTRDPGLLCNLSVRRLAHAQLRAVAVGGEVSCTRRTLACH